MAKRKMKAEAHKKVQPKECQTRKAKWQKELGHKLTKDQDDELREAMESAGEEC